MRNPGATFQSEKLVSTPSVPFTALPRNLLLAYLFGLWLADILLDLLGDRLADPPGHGAADLLGHVPALLPGDGLADLLGHVPGEGAADLLGDVGALLAGHIDAGLLGDVLTLLPGHLDGHVGADLAVHVLALLLVDLPRDLLWDLRKNTL